MYTRSFRRTAGPVPPPDYSGTALSDATVPPPAPVTVPEDREEESAGTAGEAFFPYPAEKKENVPQPAFDAPDEKPVSRKPLSDFGSDDWLLLGLIFLFLTGSREEVKEQTLLLVVLGILFFTGRDGSLLSGL